MKHNWVGFFARITENMLFGLCFISVFNLQKILQNSFIKNDNEFKYNLHTVQKLSSMLKQLFVTNNIYTVMFYLFHVIISYGFENNENKDETSSMKFKKVT